MELELHVEQRAQAARDSCRMDLRVTGKAAQGAEQAYDLTFVSLASKYSSTAISRATSSLDPDTVPKPDLLVQAALASEAQEKIRRYAHRSTAPFLPLVVSTGGYVEAKTFEVFEHWKEVAGAYAYNTMAMNVSLLLERSRCTTFRF